ncbi:hypothetical protein [Photobacterium alginatilyticum]|uniref:Uncharacterized protein n=1 Tax=Photobacterium alginatilyticum TaxID=1775171 RepID=A0ABW9YND6_9GAMM|nr:hypothetical protein [Photobacterium alginatilyticum]NBI54723.1 hypothetical protein [Photobacterium alginatilyticum]
MPVSYLNTNQAVKELFGINASCLRSKANTFVRNKTIPKTLVMNEGFADASMRKRGKVHLQPKALIPLFNAFLLDAFLGDSKIVKSTMHEPTKRYSNALLIEEVLHNLDTNKNKHQFSLAASSFIAQLKDPKFNLTERKLDTPFKDEQLPQLNFKLANTSLLRELLLKNRLALTATEQLLLAFLNKELATAYHVTQTLDSELLAQDTTLQMLVSFIQQQYKEAVSFTHFLSSLPD